MTNEWVSVQLVNSGELSEGRIIESIIGLLYKLSGQIFIIHDILIKTNCSWHIFFLSIQPEQFSRKSRLWKGSICVILRISHYLEAVISLLQVKIRQTTIRWCETLGLPSAGSSWELQWWPNASFSHVISSTSHLWTRAWVRLPKHPKCLQSRHW